MDPFDSSNTLASNLGGLGGGTSHANVAPQTTGYEPNATTVANLLPPPGLSADAALEWHLGRISTGPASTSGAIFPAVSQSPNFPEFYSPPQTPVSFGPRAHMQPTLAQALGARESPMMFPASAFEVPPNAALLYGLARPPPPAPAFSDMFVRFSILLCDKK